MMKRERGGGGGKGRRWAGRWWREVEKEWLEGKDWELRVRVEGERVW